jgi:hypothetical protein
VRRCCRSAGFLGCPTRRCPGSTGRNAPSRLSGSLLWAGWTVSFDPDTGGPLYPNQDCRIDYWARRESTREDKLNFNDVCLFHKLLRVEERAMKHGRQLFLYPPNTETASTGPTGGTCVRASGLPLDR